METDYMYKKGMGLQELFILPIRDGNHRLYLQYEHQGKLFILPIRDGNTLHGENSSGSFTPFYTSYKGWKLRSLKMNASLFLSFYTSYKGWKHRPL